MKVDPNLEYLLQQATEVWPPTVKECKPVQCVRVGRWVVSWHDFFRSSQVIPKSLSTPIWISLDFQCWWDPSLRLKCSSSKTDQSIKLDVRHSEAVIPVPHLESPHWVDATAFRLSRLSKEWHHVDSLRSAMTRVTYCLSLTSCQHYATSLCYYT